MFNLTTKERIMEHFTSRIFMVSPNKFRNNELTLSDNSFQSKKIKSVSISDNAIIEFERLKKAILKKGNKELKDKYLSQFDINYVTTADTEVIAYMYANSIGKDWFERSNYCMRYIKGAFSLLMMTKDELIGVRDPLGIRPLCLGKKNDSWVLSSESSALSHIGAEFVREIDNGETIVINKNGIESSKYSSSSKDHKMCILNKFIFQDLIQ